MDYKTIQPMDLLIRDQGRDLEGIRESLDNFVDREPISVPPEYNIEYNPEINVEVNTDGIEYALESMGAELSSLQRESIEVNRSGLENLNSLQREAIETASKGFSDISGALNGIKKVGALWLLDKSLLNPEAYLGKYRELILNNTVPSPTELATMLSQGHVYMKLYALVEMGAQRVYSSELVQSLGSANSLVAGYTGYALRLVNPPLVWKGQPIRADNGFYTYAAPTDSPAFAAFAVALRNSEAKVRSRAAKVLSGLSDGVVFWPWLLEMAGNNDEGKMVQLSATRSLLKFGRKILPDLEKKLKSLSQSDFQFKQTKIMRDSILQGYIQSPPSYLEVYRNDILGNIIPTPSSLVELVQKGSYYEKLYALAELGAQKRYDNALVAAISSKNKRVAWFAWYALSQIQPLVFVKGTEFITPVSPYQRRVVDFNSSERYIHPELSNVKQHNGKLVALANSPAFDALTTLLQNKNANVRSRAACVLGELPGGHTAYWELLRAYCYDCEKEVRAEAACSLRAFGIKIIEQLDYIIKVGGVDLRLLHRIKKIRNEIKPE